MSGASRVIRRMAGVVLAVAAVVLAVAPAALANGDTITAQATVPFSGVVDASPGCTRPTAATIDWGDGQPATSGTLNPSTHAVSGTHTYATPGTYGGTITLTGGAAAALVTMTPSRPT